MGSANLRRQTWIAIANQENPNSLNRTINFSIMVLICLNVVAIIAGTVPSIHERYYAHLYWFETISVIVFTIEYLIRIWVSVESSDGGSVAKARLKYILTPMAIIDLFAILPFYIALGGFDARMIRILRLFRIFRIAKLGRYYNSLSLIKRVIISKKEELILSTFVMGILLILSSTVMYFFENEAQPEAFSSIPAAMWWAIAALTTVGYGDVYPITVIGKMMGAVIAIIGISMFALPTGILASGFVDEIEQGRKAKELTCPNCGVIIISIDTE